MRWLPERSPPRDDQHSTSAYMARRLGPRRRAAARRRSRLVLIGGRCQAEAPHPGGAVPGLSLHQARGHRAGPDGSARAVRARARSRTGSRTRIRGTGFCQVCRDELLTLRYDPARSMPMPQRFSNQRGVTVRSSTTAARAARRSTAPLYHALERPGYTADKNIRVAGYDARLTPDMGGFLARTKRLIEQTYRANGDTPGAARRPLERPALRAVPADPHHRGLAAQVHPRLHPDRRQLPGPGQRSTRSCSPG